MTAQTGTEKSGDVHYDALTDQMYRWAKALYHHNNRNTGQTEYRQEWHFQKILDASTNVTRVQRMSERAFVLSCYALAFLPRALTEPAGGLRKAFADAAGKPFDAWRRSVHRNNLQAKFNVLGAELKLALQSTDAPAAVAMLPDLSGYYPASRFADDLETMKFNPADMNVEEISTLLRNTVPRRKGPPELKLIKS